MAYVHRLMHVCIWCASVHRGTHVFPPPRHTHHTHPYTHSLVGGSPPSLWWCCCFTGDIACAVVRPLVVFPSLPGAELSSRSGSSSPPSRMARLLGSGPFQPCAVVIVADSNPRCVVITMVCTRADQSPSGFTIGCRTWRGRAAYSRGSWSLMPNVPLHVGPLRALADLHCLGR